MNLLSAHHTPNNEIIECHQGSSIPAEVLAIHPGSAQSLSTYQIDVVPLDWNGKRPEGAFITQLDNGEWWVVFIEMKLSDTPDARVSAEAKFTCAVEHFCKSNTLPHGPDHHQEWASGRDPLSNLPDRDHKVGAVMVVTRSGARSVSPLHVNIPPTSPKPVRARVHVGSYTNIGPVGQCGKRGIGAVIDVNDLIP